ncbi:MAG: SdrD B-like domain-containing protein [Chitinophagales bacterium]
MKKLSSVRSRTMTTIVISTGYSRSVVSIHHFFLALFLLLCISVSVLGANPNGKNMKVKKQTVKPYSASIGNWVWLDSNKDGIQDRHEEGLNDFVVILCNAETHQVFSTKTSEHPKTGKAGYYSFDRLPEGKYFVVFQIPDGFEVSPKDADNNQNDVVDSDAYPISGATDIIDLTIGGKEQRWSIGLYLPTLANVD